MTKIIAISGSLRKKSSNSTILRAATILAPKGVEVSLYEKLRELPLFNPDLDGSELEGISPAPVLDFRAHLMAADAILIASPEYAHGVTGVLKNALDWVVGSGEFTNKPIGLLNGFERSVHAPAALAEILTVMGGRPLPDAIRNIPLETNIITIEEIMKQPRITSILREVLEKLIEAVDTNRAAI